MPTRADDAPPGANTEPQGPDPRHAPARGDPALGEAPRRRPVTATRDSDGRPRTLRLDFRDGGNGRTRGMPGGEAPPNADLGQDAALEDQR